MIIEQASSLYIFITAYSVGLIYPYLTSERDKVVAVTSTYRPAALAMVLFHCLSYFLSYYIGWLALVANAAYISALWLIAGELDRGRDASARKVLQETSIVFLGVLTIVWAIKSTASDARHFAYFINGMAAFVIVMILRVAARELRRSPSHYLRHALLAAGGSLFIIFVRIAQIHEQSAYVVGIGQESAILFLLRLLNAVCFFVLLNALTNLHFQRLWNAEGSRRQMAENGALQALAALAKARDHETGHHIIRTQNYVRLLARNLATKGWFALPPDRAEKYCDLLFDVAPLHDIGKIGIPDAVLLKAGRHTPEETEIMRSHALIGETVLSVALKGQSPEIEGGEMFRAAIEIAGAHHENWDGSGYPRSLKGEEIPKSARLMAIADIYDALISTRPYKDAWSHEQAACEIKRLSGTKLDPLVVAAFVEEEENFQAIAKLHEDSTK